MTLFTHNTLTGALIQAAAAGLRPHCSDPVTRELFTSEHEAERLVATALCPGCPVLTECGEAADANEERHGVWAGVDRSRPARAKRSKQRGTDDGEDLFSSVA